MTRSDHHYQVAVIGAGPMGSFAAEHLARAGIRVVLLEKDPVPGASTVCGGGMHIEVPRYAALPEQVIERYLRAFRLTVQGKKIQEWRFRTPQYVTIQRSDLDRSMDTTFWPTSQRQPCRAPVAGWFRNSDLTAPLPCTART